MTTGNVPAERRRAMTLGRTGYSKLSPPGNNGEVDISKRHEEIPQRKIFNPNL